MTTAPKPTDNRRLRFAGIIAMTIGVLVALFTRGTPGGEGVLWILIALMLTVTGLVALIKGSRKKDR